MPVYKAPVRDTLFILNDVLGYERHTNMPGFADAPPEAVAAILDGGAKLAEDVLLPLNQVGDIEGCMHYEDGSVTTPPGFREAYARYCEGGWMGLSADPAHGGQGLPFVLQTAVGEYFSAANMALTMYAGLTQGAANAIAVHGSEEQKAKWLPKLVGGGWSGTMNLTEPHCGTDLGLLRTRAVAQDDGTYRITGQKIFISSGEHDLTENIVHLVLARIEGAPDGVKGISMFIVPKRFVDEDGTPGAANGVACGSIERKMGIHGNSTCVMNYDGATGWLIGEANRGLKAMFVMMNEARLGVALQGLCQSEICAQNAAAYARERLQGRALTGAKEPEKKADPIVVHPDVRRALMTLRAFNEAARALVLWTALQVDLRRRAGQDGERERADDLLGLMTPVLKGVLSDRGFDNTVAAQQMFGGHGYIEEHGMSQFVRDARIAMIYEGANGVQALDLVGRKLGANGGRAVMAWFATVGDFCERHRDDPAMAPVAKALKKGLDDLRAATVWFMKNGIANPDDAGAGSTDYMHLFGLVALGHMWAMMVKTARDRLAAATDGDAAYLENKLTTGRFFFERIMPETGLRRARIEAGSESVMALDAAAF